MHMIDVMTKLKEIADSGYDNEDIQRGIGAAEKHQLPGTESIVEIDQVLNAEEVSEGASAECKDCGCKVHEAKPDCGCRHDNDDEHGAHFVMIENEEAGVDEVHEEVDEDHDDLSDMLKLSGQSGVIGMKSPQTLVVEDIEVQEEEIEEDHGLEMADDDIAMEGKSQGSAWYREQEAQEMAKKDGKDWSRMTYGDKEDYRAKVKAKYEDTTTESEETVDEEAVEEDTVAVPVSALADLMKLAGYENYETKVEEYANEPDAEYMDTEDQMIGLSGGMNGPKKMYPAAAGADNPMDQEPREVHESQEDYLDSFYKKYDEFVEILHQDR